MQRFQRFNHSLDGTDDRFRDPRAARIFHHQSSDFKDEIAAFLVFYTWGLFFNGTETAITFELPVQFKDFLAGFVGCFRGCVLVGKFSARGDVVDGTEDHHISNERPRAVGDAGVVNVGCTGPEAGMEVALGIGGLFAFDAFVLAEVGLVVAKPVFEADGFDEESIIVSDKLLTQRH